MARSRESRTLEFEDEYLPASEARPRRAGGASRLNSENAGRKRLLFAMVFLFFLIVFVAAVALAYQVNTFLASDPRFTLRQFSKDGLVLADGPIELVGAEHAPQRDLLAVFEPDVGRSLYLLPLAARREQLLSMDWVQDASISRLWPDRLRVVVKERRPIALAAMPGGRPGDAYRMMLVDSQGVLIRRPRQAQFDLPVVFGLSPNQPIEYREARVKLVAEVQAALAKDGIRFSEVDVADHANLRISFAYEGKNIGLILGRERYIERVRMFLERAPEFLKANPQANLFDMRQENAIVASREGLSGG